MPAERESLKNSLRSARWSTLVASVADKAPPVSLSVYTRHELPLFFDLDTANSHTCHPVLDIVLEPRSGRLALSWQI
jgi:hypothetical protein